MPVPNGHSHHGRITGIDINNEVRAVKVAQKFSNVFPSTGSRTQDVMRSILAQGLLRRGLAIRLTDPDVSS